MTLKIMSTKGIPQSQQLQQQQQQLAFQQQMHLNSLQILLTSYKDIPESDQIKSQLAKAVLELLQPFLPASTIITE